MSSPRHWRLVAVALVPLLLAACGAAPELPPPPPEPEPIAVEAVTLANAATRVAALRLPATVRAAQETTVVAQAPGTVSSVSVTLGQVVQADQRLAAMDENTHSALRIQYATAFQARLHAERALLTAEAAGAGQVQQAEMMLRTAEASLALAQRAAAGTSYSADIDLRQAELARRQAQDAAATAGQGIDEQLRAARDAVETAELARDLAREGQQIQQDETARAAQDAEAALRLASNASVATATALLTALNLQTGLDPSQGVDLPYAADLGNRDPATLVAARSAYLAAWSLAQKLRGRSATAAEALSLLQATETTYARAKVLLDATAPTERLPLAPMTPGGPSLATLQSSIGATQPQIFAAIQQLTGAQLAADGASRARERLARTRYDEEELADRQLEAARQGLRQAEIASELQRDQADGGAEMAAIAAESARAKLALQRDAAATQAELANLQAQNARVALSQARTALDAQRSGAQLQLAQATGQAELAALQLDHLNAKAPIAGVITKLHVERGDTVAPGAPIATIATTSSVVVELHVSARQRAWLRPGDRLTVLDGAGASSNAIVVRIAPAADPQTRTFLVEASPIGTHALAPGMGAVAELQLTVRAGAGRALLPLSAVQVRQDGASILIVEEGVAREVQVTVVAVEGESAEVESDLPPSTVVITHAAGAIADGSPVRVTAPAG